MQSFYCKKIQRLFFYHCQFIVACHWHSRHRYTRTMTCQKIISAKTFMPGRRDALRNIMPDNSVAVYLPILPAHFSNDVEYFYHQNPDMYYFSGYKEPHSLLLIFKERANRFMPVINTMKYYLYKKEMHRPNNGQAEDWVLKEQKKN